MFDFPIKAVILCFAIFMGATVATEFKKTATERRQCRAHGGIVFVGLKNNGVCLYAMKK